MQRKQLLPVFFVSALALALVIPAIAEDLTIVSNVTPPRGAPTTSTQYISADKVRVSDGVSDSIVDLGSGAIISIDHKKKKYFETSLEEIRAQFAEMEKMLADNPMLEQMLGDLTNIQVEKTTETRMVAGFSCTKVIMRLGAGFTFHLWITDQIQVPTDFYDARKMLHVAMGPMASNFDKMYEELKKIGGLALASEVDGSMMGMKIRSVSEATEVRKGPIPPGTFDPPAGYKKKKSPYKKK